MTVENPNAEWKDQSGLVKVRYLDGSCYHAQPSQLLPPQWVLLEHSQHLFKLAFQCGVSPLHWLSSAHLLVASHVCLGLEQCSSLVQATHAPLRQ